MARLTDIDELLFPVEEHPVFVSLPTQEGEVRVPVPEKKAIVNANSGRVLGIVGRGYRLVPNDTALEWGRRCCAVVFPDTTAAEWVVSSADAPSTGGHCFIDLTHHTDTLDFGLVQPGRRPDAFGPFVRITNSYNGLRALTLDFGFRRKVCSNGLIIKESVATFRYSHSSRPIGEALATKFSHKEFDRLKAGFLQRMTLLRRTEVPGEHFGSLIRSALAIKEPTELSNDPKKSREWQRLLAHIEALSRKYIMELGQNAYAVLNVITEFASNPPANRCLYRDRHSLQRLAGAWVIQFSQHCRAPEFSVADFLNQTRADDASRPKRGRAIARAASGV